MFAAAISAGLFSATSAHAVLTLSDGDMTVYDSDLNIYWLANANLAATNTFGVSGIASGGYMDWNTAQSWIAGMNATNYLGFNDWRLPTTLQPDASCSYPSSSDSWGYNCTGSEMGHLFYDELEGTAVNSILSSSDPDLALFQNIQPYDYWSGTGYAPATDGAWYFTMDFGYQGASYKGGTMYAWAVRDGQSVSAVPEPETYAMLLAGLGLLSFTARRRKLEA